jgi:hypothetical protein
MDKSQDPEAAETAQTTDSPAVAPSTDCYVSVESAPEGKKLNVRWGTPPQCSYGVAKRAHGTWWIYGQANPHANGRECAAPTGWHGEYHF